MRSFVVSLDRIRIKKEARLNAFLRSPICFRRANVRNGKPAPRSFLHAAAKMPRQTRRLYRDRGLSRRRRGGVAVACGWSACGAATPARLDDNLARPAVQAVITDTARAQERGARS